MDAAGLSDSLEYISPTEVQESIMTATMGPQLATVLYADRLREAEQHRRGRAVGRAAKPSRLSRALGGRPARESSAPQPGW